MTHTLGKVPVGGGRPGFLSPWQPKQLNNTAGAGPGGWAAASPTRFPLACPGSQRPGEGELGTWLLPLPWVGGGPGCRKLLRVPHFSLEVPKRTEALDSPHPTHHHHHRCLPHPLPLGCLSFPLWALPACQYCLCMPHLLLSLVPLPQGPGPAAPPSPLPPLLRGQ